MATPEARARADIDRLLTAAGWDVCDFEAANLPAWARPLPNRRAITGGSLEAIEHPTCC